MRQCRRVAGAAQRAYRLDRLGHALQQQTEHQQRDDAFLQVDERQPAGLVGRLERMPGIADVIPTGPAQEHTEWKQEQHGTKQINQRLPSAAEVVIEDIDARSEEHTSELQSIMRISYAVFCLKKKNKYI